LPQKLLRRFTPRNDRLNRKDKIMKKKIIILSSLIFLFLLLFAVIFFIAKRDISGNNKGVRFFNQGDFSIAAEVLEKESQARPQNIRVLNNLAGAQYKNEDLPAAQENYSIVVNSTHSISKEDFTALYGLGNIEFHDQKFQKAADFYIEALKVIPEDIDAKHNLEAALLRLQQSEQDQQNQEDKSLEQQKEENEQKQQENKDKQEESKEKEQDAKDKQEQSGQEKKDAQDKQKEIEDQLKDSEDKNDKESQSKKDDLQKELDKQKENEEAASKQEEAAKKEQEKQKKAQQDLKKEKEQLDKQKQELNKKLEAQKGKEDKKPSESQAGQEPKPQDKKDENIAASVLLNYFDEADQNADKLRNKIQAPVVGDVEQDW